jgi:hypothetical protein
VVAVRFLVAVSDPVNAARGEVRDMPADEAAVWADGVRAEFVTAESSEKAARRSRGGGRGPRIESRDQTESR